MNILELDSFNLADAVKFNDQLNPRIWQGQKMRPEVREKLLEIAADFKEFLGLSDLEVKDITVSGSNAGYTYTPYSDIDLHLVVDIPRADEDEVYRELFDAKKFQYNELHNIKIGGYDVELYVENANKPPVSQGVFSVANNDWIHIPRQRKSTVDDDAVRSKYEDYKHRIDSAVHSNDTDKINALAAKIKTYRQAGLDAHGELGPENLAYKMLRNQGYIEKLYKARTAARDAELSLAEQNRVKKPFVYGYTSVKEDATTTPDGVNPTTQMFLNEEDPVNDEGILKDFIDFVAKELKLNKLPIIKLRKDPQWSVMHKTFGRYMDDRNMLEVAWGQRHIMDVLRTVAHELTHRRQHEREDVPMSAGETGSPYENEANARAGILMRDYARLHPEYFKAGQAQELHGDEVSESVLNGNKIKEAEKFNWADWASIDPITGQSLSMESVMEICETYLLKTRNLLESNTTEGVSYFKDLFNLGVKPVPGSKYLMTMLMLVNDKILVSHGIEIVKVIKETLPGEYIVELPNGRTAKFPQNAVMSNIMHHTFFFTDRSQYEKLKTAIKIKFDTDLMEASGYIPTKAQAKDPRFKMALTVDVHPGQTGKEANKMALKTDSQGKPALLIKSANMIGEAAKSKSYGYNSKPLSQVPGEIEDELGNQEATGPEFPPQMPPGTTKVDVSDLTDWYRLGMDISDMDDADPEDYNQGPPQTVITFPSDEAEQGYLKQFKRLGLKTHDLDPDVEGGEDTTGKHLNKSLAEELEAFKSQDLFEVKMTGKNLAKLARDIKGVKVGLEFEMIVPNAKVEDDGDMEPDYEQDERVRDIDDCVNFFDDGDYNGRNELRRLRNDMEEAFHTWQFEKMDEEWDNNGFEFFQEYLDREDPFDEDEARELAAEELRAQYGDKLSDEEFETMLNELVNERNANYYTETWEAQGRSYDDAREEFDEEQRDNFTEAAWLDDQGIRYASDVESQYGQVSWPYYTSVSDEDETDIERIALDFMNSMGMDSVAYSSSYHGSYKKWVGNGWVLVGSEKPDDCFSIEPDGSLDGNDSDDVGLEFVSPPIPLEDIGTVMKKVQSWAADNGVYTGKNNKTSIHTNISVPGYDLDKLDYLKAALLLGDEYVLREFDRIGNSYAKPAIEKVKQLVQQKPEKAQELLDKMKSQLNAAASKLIHSGTTDKFTSINTKNNRIEFRSPGGDYLSIIADNPQKMIDTINRMVVTMDAAMDPDKYKQEYQKKLYKMLTGQGGGREAKTGKKQEMKASDKDLLNIFSRYAAGELPKAALKSFVRQAQLERSVAKGKETGKMWWRVGLKSNPNYGIEVVGSNRAEAIQAARDANTDLARYNFTDTDFTAKPIRPYEEKPEQPAQQGPGLYKIYDTRGTLIAGDEYENDQSALRRAQYWAQQRNTDVVVKNAQGQEIGRVSAYGEIFPTTQQPAERPASRVRRWEIVNNATGDVVQVFTGGQEDEAADYAINNYGTRFTFTTRPWDGEIQHAGTQTPNFYIKEADTDEIVKAYHAADNDAAAEYLTQWKRDNNLSDRRYLYGRISSLPPVIQRNILGNQPAEAAPGSGEYGIWIQSSERFARVPLVQANGNPNTLRTFPSREAAEEYLSTTRGENPRVRNDIEVREIPQGYELPPPLGRPVSPAFGGSHSEPVNYEIYNRNSGAAIDTFTANSDDEALQQLEDYRNSGRHSFTPEQAQASFGVRRAGQGQQSTTQFGANTPQPMYELVRDRDNEVVYRFFADNQDDAIGQQYDFIRMQGWNPDEYTLQAAENYRPGEFTSTENVPREGRPRNLVPTGPGPWEIYRISNGESVRRLEHTNRAAAEEEARSALGLRGEAPELYGVRTQQSTLAATGSDAAQGGIVDVATDRPATTGSFTGEWKVMINGEEVYRFGGVGNSQSDANRVGRDWILQQIRSRTLNPANGADVEVLPVMG